MAQKIRVGIAHRYQILNELLSEKLTGSSRFEIVGVAHDVQQIIKLVEKRTLHVLLLDPFHTERESLDLVQTLTQLDKNIRIISLFVDDNLPLSNRLMRAGVKGFITRNFHIEELIKAIETVFKGNPHVPQLVSSYIATVYGKKAQEDEVRLTPRETQVMSLLVTGKNTKEIAQMLCIDGKTVASHRASALDKLGVRNNVELTLYAIKQGYLTV